MTIGDPDTATAPRRSRWALPLIGGVALIGIGVAGGVVWSERSLTRTERAMVSQAPSDAPSHASAAAPGSPAPPAEPAEVTLSAEAIARAGITTSPVTVGTPTTSLAVPATIASNAYRETKVHSLVGGIVRQVDAELGATVRRGQTLTVVFSHELADAQMKYLSARAMLDFDHGKRERTQQLVALGAASRQELEEIAAVHEMHATEVAAARQRLLLLGLTPSQVDALREASGIVSEVTIGAPADGIVIARSVNPGQVVVAAQDLFTVADLGTVWAIGDLYEKDFSAVRVGTAATLTSPTGGAARVRGRVTYIDPRVDPATRTAKVRVEVPNREGALRLGMFVTLTFDVGGGHEQTLIPRSAVQSSGARSFVYVDAGDGRFVERPVRLGGGDTENVVVLAGLEPGERIVTAGSYFLRAEAARTRGGG